MVVNFHEFDMVWDTLSRLLFVAFSFAFGVDWAILLNLDPFFFVIGVTCGVIIADYGLIILKSS